MDKKDAEETKSSGTYDENSDTQQKMSQSFYAKEGLDYLYFNRPGTAYNNPAAFGFGTATRS